MKQIDGCTAQELFVSGLLTISHLDSIIQALLYFHALPLTQAEIDESRNHLHDNYLPKMIARGCSINAHIRRKLEDHEARIGMIHGDPSLCNIIVQNKTNNLMFIDPKGKLGEIITVAGDIHYDFAKVYQSLIGYCEIMEGVAVRDEYKQSLVKYFVTKCNVAEDTLKVLATSLVISLMPLHGPKHQHEFEMLLAKLQTQI